MQGYQRPRTRVKLMISCSDLRDKDILSKSDPQVYVYQNVSTTRPPREEWREIGRTEMVANQLSPTFAKTVELDYFFEEVQTLKFVVVDVDDPRGSIEQQDFLGQATITLAELVTSSRAVPLKLKTKENNIAFLGTVNVRAMEVKKSKVDVIMQVSGSDFVRKGWFSTPRPFMELHKEERDGTFTMLNRTPVIVGAVHPNWPVFRVPGAMLFEGDATDASLLFRVYHEQPNSGPKLVGEVRSTVQSLSQGKQLHVHHPIKPNRPPGRPRGTLTLTQFVIEPIYSFLDYLAGGMHLHLIVSVDFTASNGDPRQRSSLHHISPALNPYQRAIQATGSVLEPYDAQRTFPAYGFGVKMADDTVSHLFALNGNPSQPHVRGVQGILDAYTAALHNVTLWGPTLFTPTLNQVDNIIRSTSVHGQDYYVLLMLTDGEVTDMQSTIDAIINASALPLSIVIVGVGNADFSKMEKLDADDVPLVSSFGRRAERDIVQFVPFSKFSNTMAYDADLLAKEVLAEIPDQVIQYMRYHGIKPQPVPPPYDAAVASSSTSAPVAGSSQPVPAYNEKLATQELF